MFEINYTKLNEVLQAFYRTTGARVGIFDENKNEILCYPQDICKLCKTLRNNPHINKRCINSDQKAFEICKRTKAPYTYECDMGLYESVAPIITDGKIIAYVMMGQVACISSKSGILDRASKYFSDMQEINSIVNKLKNISIDQLTSSAYLMNICVEYLFATATITHKDLDFYGKLDKYISNNMQNKILADDVCNCFGISRTTLHYQLKNKYHMNFSQRLNYLRIEKAKKMLINKIPIEDICSHIGISEKSYFYKTFKNITGKTIKEFLIDNISI